MPISGNNTFCIRPQGDNSQKFSQLAQCTYSPSEDNIGQLFWRACVSGVFGGWHKLVTNSDLPRFINNNDGNGKQVTTTDWTHLGTSITIPDGYVAILYAQRGYHTGQPNGLCISTSSTDMTQAIRAINQPTDATYNNHIIHITMLAGAGVYYLWSKGAIGISSEFIHAVLIKLQ